MPDIIKSIRDWRVYRAFTLDELAHEAGVRRSTLWNWEVGKAKPTPTNRRKLAKALNVRVEQIAWDEIAVTIPKKNAA